MIAGEKTDCPVCSSGIARPQVLAMLELTLSPQEMADTTGFPVEQIQAHLEHLATDGDLEEIADDPMQISDARLQVLFRRAQEVYQCAGLQSDTKAMATALSTLFRIENENRRRLEESRNTGESNKYDPHTPDTWSPDQKQFLRDIFDAAAEDLDKKTAETQRLTKQSIQRGEQWLVEHERGIGA